MKYTMSVNKSINSEVHKEREFKRLTARTCSFPGCGTKLRAGNKATMCSRCQNRSIPQDQINNTPSY